MAIIGLLLWSPCFAPITGKNDEKELKNLTAKAELEKAASGDPTALRHVLDSLVLKHTSEYFDVVSAINIYKTALKNNPNVVNHAKIKPILFLIPVLDMASQAGNLDVSALASGFSFDSPFHGRTFYSDGQITAIAKDKMYAACAYMAEQASVSHDLGIQDPKLIFQLVFRFFIIPLTETMGIPSWESDHKTATKVITTYYKAWKSNTIIPFFPDAYMMSVFGARYIVPAIESEREIKIRKTITEKMLDQVRYLSSDLHHLCQETYQKALVFFTSQAFAENPDGASDGQIQAKITKRVRGFYDDFYEKTQHFQKESIWKNFAEWPFYSPEQQKITNPAQRHHIIKQQLDKAEKEMHDAFRKVLVLTKKSSRPFMGLVTALRTVQMHFLAFSNALGLLYGQMYRNPEQSDFSAMIADQVRLNMVKQRTIELLLLKKELEQ